MASPTAEPDFTHLQDILGSLPMLRSYIVLCLCFELTPATPKDQVLDALRSASDKLADNFPFLAGRVIIDGVKDDCSGVPKIISHEKKITLVVNDLTQDTSFPDYIQMRDWGFPFSMMDANVLAPPVTQAAYPTDPSIVAPVLIMQANLIKGGLILTVAANHTIMDATGQGIVIELFAKACRGEVFTDEDKKWANQSRATAVPLLGPEYQPGPELDDLYVDPNKPTQRQPGSTFVYKWAYFMLRDSKLIQLKQDAGHQQIVPYISTDDAIGALCWQSVARARKPRLGSGTKTLFARPIALRRFFGLQNYIGHMVDNIYSDAVDVDELPIGDVAGKLRLALQQEDQIKYHAQALATALSRVSDRSKFIYGARLDLDRDLLITSWSNMATSASSYGPLLGQPQASRLPRGHAFLPLMTTMPKDKDGGIALAVCMSEDELDRLRKDSVFSSYAEYIG